MMNVGERERRFVEEALMALVEVGLTTVEVEGELVKEGLKVEEEEIVGETVLGIQRLEKILVERGGKGCVTCHRAVW